MYKPEREQALAKTALALMAECSVIATPDNFELFYAYASGENPAITQAMGALISARRPFTPDILMDLRLRCLSGARAAQAMDSLGGNMSQLIDDVMGKLAASARDANAYKDTLSAATGELGNDRSPADMRKLVDGLIAATRAMEQRAKSLEGELQASSQQVTELRGKLADVRKESLTDPLTNVANRKAFDEAVKAAIDAVTKSHAKEFGARKIRVNSVNPGMIITEGVKAAGYDQGDMRQWIESITPLGRVGKVDEIANTVAFFASEGASYITGETLHVTGGPR